MYRFHGLDTKMFDIVFLFGIKTPTAGGKHTEEASKHLQSNNVKQPPDDVTVSDLLLKYTDLYVLSRSDNSWKDRKKSSEQGYNLGITVFPKKATRFDKYHASCVRVEGVKKVINNAIKLLNWNKDGSNSDVEDTERATIQYEKAKAKVKKS